MSGDFTGVPKLQEIVEVLRQARTNPHYVRGTPDALDHLLVHVVAALEDIERRLDSLQKDSQ